ncbi:polysaccharide biosynthesis/export family protein [Microbulbifer sediminum]|uniref:polysaccharide biosynthesis/export family protein n=1 Tax=Microbulbifer sediminum TaxID=2904250 RepID=UPI002102CC09|nr:polysaccharide biosynthesis/export family protein [Microbulbifer sediminum]
MISRSFRSIVIATWLAFPLLVPVTVTAQAQTEPGEYRLGPGDRIQVTVYGESDLTMEILLNDSGVVNYPFLGEIRIGGHSVKEVEELLVAGLKGDYLVNPSISVAIVEYRPFYIYGEVQVPGGYPYRPGLTVGKAAALAQGLTERASERRIFIVRESGTADRRIEANLNTQLRPGDVVTVEQGLF